MAAKIGGKLVHEYQGLTIYVSPRPAKTARGKDRVWIQIRQSDPKKHWSQDKALVYRNAADICFVGQ
jgi:hypothetical protein